MRKSEISHTNAPPLPARRLSGCPFWKSRQRKIRCGGLRIDSVPIFVFHTISNFCMSIAAAKYSLMNIQHRIEPRKTKVCTLLLEDEMTNRDRAAGWKHAKLTGHDNEKLVAELTKTDKDIQKRLLNCARQKDAEILDVQYGGLCENDVECILGGKTKQDYILKQLLKEKVIVRPNCRIQKILSQYLVELTEELKRMQRIEQDDDILENITYLVELIAHMGIFCLEVNK